MNKSPAIRVKQYPEDQPGYEKPYLGYRRNRGMPSAREPISSLDLTGPKAFHMDEKINNAKGKFCKKRCDYRSKRKMSGCQIYTDITKCNVKNFKKTKIAKQNYKPPLKGLGIYDK